MAKIKERWYQKDAVDAFAQFVSTHPAGHNPLIVMPTGTGKSVVIALIIKWARQWQENKVLVLTHVSELVKQNGLKLAAVYPEAVIGYCSAGLGLRDTVASFILPGMLSTYYVILMRSFFTTVPKELEEAGEIDGLSKFKTFFKIALPLSKPIIATMALFYLVFYWNNWFDAFLYLDSPEKWPVAYYLRQLISSASSTADPSATAEMMQISANIKSCAMVLTAAPIICVYPFIQKYFVQGMMLGGVKG